MTMRLHRRDLVCADAVRLVTDYLDGALSRRDRRRFERHVAQCEHCGEHVKQIAATIRATGYVRVDDLDEAAQADLLDLYRRWRAGRA